MLWMPHAYARRSIFNGLDSWLLLDRKKIILVLLHSIMFRIYGLGLRASEDKQATCTGYVRYCVCMEKLYVPMCPTM